MNEGKDKRKRKKKEGTDLAPLQSFGHLMQRADSLENTLMLGGIGGRRRGRQDEMAGSHHRLDGHESE